MQQDVIECLFPLARGFNGDTQILLKFGLPGEISQTAWPQTGFELSLALLRRGGDNVLFAHVVSAYRTSSRARRNSGSKSLGTPAALALRTAASAAGRW